MLYSDTETGNPLVAGFEDDLSSADEMPVSVQPKLAENPLSKQRHKRGDISLGAESNFEPRPQITKRDSTSSIEQELQIANKMRVDDQNDGNSDDTFDSWLGQDTKWRQSPEGGEDVSSSAGTKKDRHELSDKSLDASVTSSNVHLELLDSSSIRHLSSNGSSPVMKEKKKHRDKVRYFDKKQSAEVCLIISRAYYFQTEDKEKKKKKKSKDKDKEKEKSEKSEKKKRRSAKKEENRKRDELEEFLNGSSGPADVEAAYEAI